ncbi:MAG: aminoacyl-tRNA hydrolase, partial [Anaerolineales bacterium]|nr:aminoacyl-tRNA hydrolase [Anaerolineales bacterium]
RFLIVGLGNPGREHKKNRHNIGFMAIDQLAETWGISLGKVQQRAITGQGRVGEDTIILAKPQTYMNSSGDAVGPLARYFKVPTENVLVIYDEIDIPFGALRIRSKGGSGGHNGMKSIINHLGQDFPRIRIGVGRPQGKMPPAAYVLQDFKGAEWDIVTELLAGTVAAVNTFIREGIDLSMSRHNRG